MGAYLPSSNWSGLFDGPDLRVTAGAWSVQGSERETNEDCEYISPKHDLFIVADGMGGHAAGEQASHFVVDTLTHELARICGEAHTTGEIKKLVRDAVKEAHCLVVDMGEMLPSLRGSGSTVVLALLFGSRLFIAGVGDSTAYLLRNKTLDRLNDDDSYCAVLERAGEISHEEAKSHPARHQLLSALGVESFSPSKEIRVLDVQAGDRYLLCTDGVSDVLEPEEIQQILERHSNSRVAAKKLVEEAIGRGSTDDATSLVFAVRESGRTAVPVIEPPTSAVSRIWNWLRGNPAAPAD